MHHTKSLLLTLVLVAGLAGCASGPERQGAGDYIRDSAITTRIKAAFLGDPDIHAMDIKVETTDGKVHLTGHAGSQQEIDRAVEIATSISGVQGVANHIELQEPSEISSATEQNQH